MQVLQQKQKSAYAPPRLTRYGDVSLLTRTGTKGTNETFIFMLSTRRSTSSITAKENVVRIGEHPWGFGLYLFDYEPEYCDRCGHGRQFGVIAEEVEQVVPEAVSRSVDGLRAVDYARLGIRRQDS